MRSENKHTSVPEEFRGILMAVQADVRAAIHFLGGFTRKDCSDATCFVARTELQRYEKDSFK